MPIQKQSKPEIYSAEYNFGDPEIIEIEVSGGVVLRFREPDVEDLLSLTEIEKETQGNEILQTLQTICLLHTPEPPHNKITIKEAKRLKVQDLKKIGKAISGLVSFEDLDEEYMDNKS